MTDFWTFLQGISRSIDCDWSTGWAKKVCIMREFSTVYLPESVLITYAVHDVMRDINNT